LDFRQLRYFVALYEEGHMGRAAERLCLSQPALSQQVRQLEQAEEVELFRRLGRRLQPTLAAHTLYSHALPLLAGLEQAREALRGFRDAPPQRLAIGMLQTVNAGLVPALLERLREVQPQVQVQISELSGNEVERRLLAGTLDIGIGFLPPRQPGLHSLELFEDEMQLVIGPEHPLKEFRKVSVAQAAALPMLLLGEEYRVRQVWQEQLAVLGRRPHVSAELNHVSAVLGGLPQGALASVLPGRTLRARSHPDLLWKPLVEPRIPMRVGLVYRDAQRQQGALELLRTLLDGLM
jgi:LysR family cyn operon transcriptional activator